jgi:hypothetical protein
MQRQEPDALFVVLGVHPVHFVVALNYFARVLAVAIHQRVHRLGNLTLDQSAHLEQPGAQAAQIFFVLPIGMLRLCTIHFRLPDISRTCR